MWWRPLRKISKIFINCGLKLEVSPGQCDICCWFNFIQIFEFEYGVDSFAVYGYTSRILSAYPVVNKHVENPQETTRAKRLLFSP